MLSGGFGVAYLLLLLVPVLPLVAVSSRLGFRWSLLAVAITIVVEIAISPAPPWSIASTTAQGTLVQYLLSLGVPVMIAVGAWLAGCAMLERQRYADAVLARAATIERTRDAEAARAVAEERAQVARELHDVVTHTVAVMVVQAADAGRVVVLTTFDLDEYVYGALRAGAAGFLLKDARPEELIAAVRVVARGDGLLAPQVTRRLIERFATDLAPGSEAQVDAAAQLTEREREVLRLLAGGRSNLEIADTLVLSEATIKTHVSNILGKLGLRDRVQAVTWAYEHALVRPGQR